MGDASPRACRSSPPLSRLSRSFPPRRSLPGSTWPSLTRARSSTSCRPAPPSSGTSASTATARTPTARGSRSISSPPPPRARHVRRTSRLGCSVRSRRHFRTSARPSTSRTRATRSAADLWASRYMAWMALGGTLKRIPQDVLHLVTTTPILGYPRENIGQLPGASDPTGNMLNLAKGLCAMVLPTPTHNELPDYEKNVYAYNNNSLLPPAPRATRRTTTRLAVRRQHVRQGDVAAPLQRLQPAGDSRLRNAPARPQTRVTPRSSSSSRCYYAVHPDPARAASPADTANYPADRARLGSHVLRDEDAADGRHAAESLSGLPRPEVIPADQGRRARSQAVAAGMSSRFPEGCRAPLDQQPGSRARIDQLTLRREHPGLGAPWRDRVRHVGLQLSRATHERSDDGEAVAVLRSVRVAAVTLRARDLQHAADAPRAGDRLSDYRGKPSEDRTLACPSGAAQRRHTEFA